MVDLRSQYLRIKPEVDAAIQCVLDSTTFIQGDAVSDFEQHLSQYVDSKYVVSCGNGTDALTAALLALGIGPGDEVVTVPFTFIATVEAIAQVGAKPVLVDVREDSYMMDADKLEAAITPKTKAVIPVHLYGQCADMFFPSKNLGCYGDGGALMTQDEELSVRLRMICRHGSKERYRHEIVGINSRLDTLQAAILNVKLNHLDAFITARKQAADYYHSALSGMEWIVVPQASPNSTHTYHQFTVTVQNGRRDALGQHLASHNIPTMIYYPVPAHLQPAYASLNYREGDFPVAERLCSEVLSLPMHTELTEEQLEYICQTIKNFPL